MNRLTTITLLALSGLLAGCSNMPMQSMFASGGTGTDSMTSSGGAGSGGTNSNSSSNSTNDWYNGRQDISRSIYFGG